MSSQDRLENVLRDIHVMISKSETYDADRIIVSKQDIFNLIDRLNVSIYEIMDEYELTQQSRDRALREKKKEGDKIIWDASRQAEDIYAASVMYTEEALNHLHVIVEEADATVGKLYKEFQDSIRQQEDTIRENHLELKSQLQLLADTEKYLKLIEERNREIEREKADKKGRKTLGKFGEKHKAIKPEIKINEEYFRKAGIPLETDKDKDENDYDDGQSYGTGIEGDGGVVMEPLADEGVIESTLKKADEGADETAMKKADGDMGGSAMKKSGEDADGSALRKADEGADGSALRESGEDADGFTGKSAKKAAGEGTDEPAGKAAGEDAGKSAKKAADEGTGESALQEPGEGAGGAARKDPDEGEEKSALKKPGEKSGQEGTEGSGQSREGQPGADGLTSGTKAELARDAIEESEMLKLDAEYFKWKNEGQEETAQQPSNWKQSLLDKLMGKKR